jgi:hypothetical protein
MAESATAWQTQQKEKATTTQIKKPDIPGDYGGQQIPPVPNTENFLGGRRDEGLAWLILLGGATLLLVALRQRLK